MYKKGYKAFNRIENSTNSGQCRDVVFEEGKVYEIEGKLELCANGFHFCKDLVLTSQYYDLNHETTIYAEVEALGDVVYEEPTKHKCATDKIKIVRFMSVEEVCGLFDEIDNSGDCNSGNRNSGDCNSGNRNSGDCNSGNRNSGYYNSGDCNSGNRNSGDYNSGDYNSGDCNSGYYNSGYYNSGNRNSGYYNSGNRNSGDYNSGDWNKTDFNTGYFNTEPVTQIKVFNKYIDKQTWDNCDKPSFLYFKLDAPTYKKSFIKSFNKASKEDVKLLINLPNFDYDVFEDISGITKEMIENKLKS